jgi:hypothetical protein
VRRGGAFVLAAALVLAGCGVIDERTAPAAPVASPSRAEVPVEAAAAATIALSPAREWLGLDRVIMASEGLVSLPPRATVVFTREEAPDGPAVFVQRVDEPAPANDGEEPLGDPVAAGPWSGLTGIDEASGHRWLAIGRGPQHLSVWAGPDRTVDELMELATSLDPGQPIDAQKAVGGWRQRTTSERALSGATVRQVHVRRDDLGADLHLTTWRGVDESALLVLGSATVARPQRVRGRAGLVLAAPGAGDAVVTWIEAPGVVAQVRYAPDHPREPDRLVSEALEAATNVTRLDAEGWEQLASRARQRQEKVRPTADQLDPPRVVFTGRFLDGRAYSVTERQGQYLCVHVEGNDGITRCDTDRQFWRGRSTQAMPRLLDPGDPADARSPVLLYGYLPEIALGGEAGLIQSTIGPWLEAGRAVSVHVSDRRGRDLGWATIVDDVWVHHVHDNDMPLIVTYRFRDGSEVEIVPGPGRTDGEAR